MPTNRVYPTADNVATWYADKSSSVSTADDVAIGTHVGQEAPSGVGIPEDFEGYTPIHRIDSHQMVSMIVQTMLFTFKKMVLIH